MVHWHSSINRCGQDDSFSSAPKDSVQPSPPLWSNTWQAMGRAACTGRRDGLCLEQGGQLIESTFHSLHLTRMSRSSSPHPSPWANSMTLWTCALRFVPWLWMLTLVAALLAAPAGLPTGPDGAETSRPSVGKNTPAVKHYIQSSGYSCDPTGGNLSLAEMRGACMSTAGNRNSSLGIQGALCGLHYALLVAKQLNGGGNGVGNKNRPRKCISFLVFLEEGSEELNAHS